MTDIELKELKDRLWHSADILRAGAHLAANKYGQPILGLIFLRYADILFKQHKEEIESEFAKLKGTRRSRTLKDISIEKCGFYLPECAYFDKINDAPDDAEKATLVKNAMQAIEDENERMQGVLPKEVYAQLVPEEEPELLSKIVRIFKDIPENCTVDIFGEISNLTNFVEEDLYLFYQFYLPPGYKIDNENEDYQLYVSQNLESEVRPNLKSITQVYTYHFSESGLTDTLRRKVTLAPINGAVIEPRAIEVMIPVERMVLRTQKVHVSVRNMPPNVNVIVFPSVVEVTYRAPMSYFNNNNKNNAITAVVDYNSININTPGNKVELMVGEVPGAFENVSLELDSVEYIIEKH